MDVSSATGLQRSACDRCRSHKLRCERSEKSGARDCKRCIRSGSKCVTGPSLRTGRPRTSSDSGPLSPPDSCSNRSARRRYKPSASRTSGSCTPEFSSSPGTSTHNENAVLRTELAHTHNSISGPQQASQPVLHGIEPPNESNCQFDVDPYPGFDDLFGLAINQAPSLMTPASLGTAFAGTKMPDTTSRLDFASSQWPDLSAFTPSICGSVIQGRPSLVPSEDGTTKIPSATSPAYNASPAVALRHLSHLSSDLMQDLQEQDHTTDRTIPATAHDLRPEPSFMAMSLDHYHGAGRVLKQSEEFVQIVNCLVSTSSSPGGDISNSAHPTGLSPHTLENSASSTPSTFAHSHLSTPTLPAILSFLTCYTCLMRRYSHILGKIRQHLHAGSLEHQRSSEISTTLPGLNLCGLRLERYPALQLDLIARTTLYMLQQLQSKLREVHQQCSEGNSPEEKHGANLVNIVLTESHSVVASDGSDGETPMREVVASIREALDQRIASLG